ncbi:hypothetical protein DL769_003245 [Monosporascus sp. CRB-8-3]|nr:hypothetical protein DL769_003245 [Monosporascus sp. CRB-8-3]
MHPRTTSALAFPRASPQLRTMDPVQVVGLVASIIQLIETTAKVIGYVNDVKDAPTERAQFARHASSLLALLTDLRYQLEEAKIASDPWFVALRDLGAGGGPLDQLQDQMERLATKLEPSIGRLKKLGKTLIWAVDKKEIEAVLAQIERVKTLVMLALQNDQLKLALAMKRDLIDVKEDLRAAIGETIAEREDEEFQEVTAWLSSLDFATKQIDFLNRRQAGTGDWLLSDLRFQRWLAGKERTLWCPGLPGAGKTTLASMVIDWLQNQHQDTHAAVIYLYCSYKEEEVQTPQNMIGSLLKQIIQHRAALPADVRGLYNKHHRKKTYPKLDELARLLVGEIKTYSFIFVVIDALDECPERGDHRGRLLAEIQKLPQNARILITSRYSPKIEERFENAPHIDIRATDEDIKRYIEARIEKERSLAKHVHSNPALMEEITKTIVKSSQGMFLLAQLHMDSLAKRLTRREIRKALGNLPKELDETYDQAMQRIQNQDEGQAALAHKVLYWISCSLRPLTVAELRHALAVEPGDDDLDEDGLYETELMISVCAGLVTVDEESNQIRLVHYTTQSYFNRIRIARFPQAPSIIAKTCLTYLAFSPFAEKYCSSEVELTTRLDKYPFLRYAASYWGDHIRDGMDDDVRELALEYLSNNISILSTDQAFEKARTGLYQYKLGGRVANLTRLHAVALFGLVDIARDLLADGVDVDARADWDTTPLHLAAKAGHTQMVRLLLQAGAKVAPEATFIQTPLHMAAQEGHESVVQILIDAGADCNDRRTIQGKSPLHLAAEYGHFDVAQVLIEKGADVNQEDAVAFYRKIQTDRESSPGLDDEKVSDDDDDKGEELGGTPLNRAAEQGHEAIVLLLLNNGADISATEEGGRTALHQAARAGHVKLVQLLITRGIDVSTEDKSGQTALHCAAGKGQAEIVQILLENNANVLAEDRRGNTAVHEAAGCECDSVLKILLERIGKANETERWLATTRLRVAVNQADEDEVRLLLEKGADPNVNANKDIPLLHIAVVHENPNVLRLLLANGASVSMKESFGRTPLHWAAYRGYDTGVRLLLDHDADIQAADVDGTTPLHMATGHGNASVVKRLLDNGARLDAKDNDKRTALSWVFNSGGSGFYTLMLKGDHHFPTDQKREDEEQKNKRREEEEQEARERLAVLDLLIEEGADLNEPQPYWNTILLLALQNGRQMVRVALIRRLLEKGADVAAQTDDGRSALYLATYLRLPEIARLLLEYGADVNQTIKKRAYGYDPRRPYVDGVTALHQAAGNGSEEIARLLVDAGADVNAVDKDGMTALHEAVTHGCESIAIVDLLLAHGVDINAHHGGKKATVLHHAAIQGNVAMVRYLLQKGARITATDVDGMTALDWAKDTGHEAMIFFLLSLKTKQTS